MPNILILAGGYGTRLNGIVDDLPKPLAPINNKPFLQFQIAEIRKYFSKDKIHLLTYHLSDKIEDYYSNDNNINIIKENNALGTGGAIKNAIKVLNLHSNDDLLIFNGDTYMMPELDTFINRSIYDVNIISMFQEECERSSTLVVENNVIKNFSKQGIRKRNSLISVGCYYIRNSSFITKNNNKYFMIEDEFIKYGKLNNIGTYLYDGIFIDIGIPEDYQKMKEYINNNENK